jgi:hypothetical protein
LYLRRVISQDGCHYVIRASYRDGECWRSEDLADLGADPATHVEYAGRNSFYFSSDLEEKLQAKGVKYSIEDLEELFLPFLPPHIRRLIESFQTHTTRRHGRRTCSEQELTQKQRGLHSFDKRRLHFLRCGRVDIGDLDRRPWKFLNVIMEKSRDEIEHVIEDMERVLRPHELCPYLFTALHLQSRFPHHLLRNHPAALDRDEVDNYFLEELCAVNEDETYFAGMERFDRTTLHPLLVKYLVLYFDSEFEGNAWPEQLVEFMRRRAFYRRLPAVRRMDIEEACTLFGISKEEVVRLDRNQLARLYRCKAKELHPDRGGDKESFIRMSEAFACLTEQKS